MHGYGGSKLIILLEGIWGIPGGELEVSIDCTIFCVYLILIFSQSWLFCCCTYIIESVHTRTDEHDRWHGAALLKNSRAHSSIGSTRHSYDHPPPPPSLQSHSPKHHTILLASLQQSAVSWTLHVFQYNIFFNITPGMNQALSPITTRLKPG